MSATVQQPENRELFEALATHDAEAVHRDCERVAPGRRWEGDIHLVVVQVAREVLDLALAAYRYEVEQRSPDHEGIDASATASLIENFVSENAFIMEQLQCCDFAPPFTLQRLAEILLNPFEHHTRRLNSTECTKTDESSSGEELATPTPAVKQLRGLMLQSAIRKCVLVAPVE